MAATVQSILQEYFEQFAQNHPLSFEQRLAAERMRDCRTPALGGHLVGCPEGHVRTVCCNSCRHRNCPLCSAFAREKWLAAWKERLLDCPHHHIVFTVPHELIPLWRYNKREFADTLFRAGVESLRELLADPKYLGALPGMLAALHTWDQTLLIHPHLHVMVTAGGLDDEGSWCEPQKNCLLPRQVLMQVFRGKMRAFLLKSLEQGRLTLPPDKTLTAQKNLLNRLGRTTWNVKILDRYAHGRGVATYLANYLKGGPIGNGRIIDVQQGLVRIRCREREADEGGGGGGRRRIVRLPVDEFLARLLEHVPPSDMQTVRPYGLYANSKRAELAQAGEHFGQTPRPEKRSLSWYEFCAQHGIHPPGDAPASQAFSANGEYKPRPTSQSPKPYSPGGRDDVLTSGKITGAAPVIVVVTIERGPPMAKWKDGLTAGHRGRRRGLRKKTMVTRAVCGARWG
jgi:hypothetical protein